MLALEKGSFMPKLKDFSDLLVKDGEDVDLRDYPTGGLSDLPAREEAEAATDKAVQRLGELQDALYAEGRQSLLVVLQGMDASGKDGAVRKVFDAVNPTGVQVTSFKQPTSEDLRHDFLWRVHQKTPARGYLGVFNRSHYEDVLVVRVHADALLAPELRDDKKVWQRRYEMINAFEEALSDARTRTVKFFLHISKDEQRQRFIARQKEPDKHWKLAAGDFEERKYWDDYQHAYEKMLPATSTERAPWYIIPADRKWARNYYMSHILVGILEEMDPKPPEIADRSLVRKRFK
jgi:PPK2 family polyphosphate:nucleotide phosphotransferase